MRLIIDIPEEDYKRGTVMASAIRNGIPLDSNSERAEVQAYFAGEAYGWEEGRKALIEDVRAEIVKAYDDVTMYSCDEQVSRFASTVCGILNNIGKESEE